LFQSIPIYPFRGEQQSPSPLHPLGWGFAHLVFKCEPKPTVSNCLRTSGAATC
jgi:hypothetical protein